MAHLASFDEQLVVALDFLQRSAVLPRPETKETWTPVEATVAAPRGPFRTVLLGVGALFVFVVVALGVLAVVARHDSLSLDSTALAHVSTPLVGGSVASVAVFKSNGVRVPVAVRGKQIWPLVRLRPNLPLTVVVSVKRPGWIAWLAGKHARLLLTLRTPRVSVLQRYLTKDVSAPLTLRFSGAVAAIASGQLDTLKRRVLSTPSSHVALADTSGVYAGTVEVAAIARSWESFPSPTVISWFPGGAGASAVLSPAAGQTITPTTPIYITSSRPIYDVMGRGRPTISPQTDGSWHTVDSHTIVFRPSGYGFGLGATVTIDVPGHVHLVGGSSDHTASWSVPPGSPLRAEQILAQLGYLPLNWTPAHAVAAGHAAQAAAAANAPAGKFTWRYGNVPASLKSLWQPGESTQLTRGALMSFENNNDLTTDGLLGPTVWRALMSASDQNTTTNFGFTYVMVSEATEHLRLWHNGKFIFGTPVNTGIAAAPTATGTFNVYEHLRSTTMSGLNPDGSAYHDPNIQWVSYFNGGDALHAFTRAQYGFPQSLGCVEMPLSSAGTVWPYTPIGTIVNIT